MKNLNELNSKLSQAIKKRSSFAQLQGALVVNKVPESYHVSIYDQPVKVPLCYLIPVLNSLNLKAEIFDICCMRF